MSAAAPAELSATLDSLFDDVTARIDGLIHQYGEDNVKLAMRGVYLKYIAPLNVPYVPDALEPVIIDTPAMMMLDRLFDYFHSKIHREPTP